MSRINIPIDVLTSRLNLSDRFASVRSTSLATRFSNLKPISEFLDFKRLSKPENFGEVQSRVNYNLGYFSSNYAVVFLMLALYALFTNWTLLFVIFLVVGGMWGIGKLEGGDLQLGFTTLTSSQLYTTLLIIAVPLTFIASPIYTFLWLIGFFWGGGLGSRPRSPKRAPLWGRQPGAPTSRRERERAAWEREASLADIYHDSRIEELGSSDESGAQSGVGLDFSKKRFASDPLQFTGIDLAAKPRARRGYAYQESSSDDSDESDNSQVSERQIALRNREEALVQSALARIKRAHEKGKTEVKLDPEELEALERRKQKMKTGKSKRVTVPLAPPPEISDTRRRQNRQLEASAPPPGMLVAGPEGNLVYAPLGQYPPQALSNRPPSGGSTRVPSNPSRNGGSPSSYYPPSPNARHTSDPQMTTLSHLSSSPRPRDSLAHDEGWTRVNADSSRRSSGSSAASSSRQNQRNKAGGYTDPFAFQVDDEFEEHGGSSIPGQFIESPVSSRQPPGDVIYSNYRRSLPGQNYATNNRVSLSPTSNVGGLAASISDPLLSSSRPRNPRHSQHLQYEEKELSENEENIENELAGHGRDGRAYVDEEQPSSSARGESYRTKSKYVAVLPRKPVGGGGTKAKKGRKGK